MEKYTSHTIRIMSNCSLQITFQSIKGAFIAARISITDLLHKKVAVQNKMYPIE
ncbi:hypothetical protein JFU03_10380 [Bacillus sp. TH44]|uniref:hypothetical protein n=1 Tax=Bacillus mycoides TaxID=1405 RepID=UPI001560841B|nr:hypothetical protein [Bacillus mycoides]MBK5358630.1 hypothetical protein [Bacillus sp. TH44]